MIVKRRKIKLCIGIKPVHATLRIFKTATENFHLFSSANHVQFRSAVTAVHVFSSAVPTYFVHLCFNFFVYKSTVKFQNSNPTLDPHWSHSDPHAPPGVLLP